MKDYRKLTILLQQPSTYDGAVSPMRTALRWSDTPLPAQPLSP